MTTKTIKLLILALLLTLVIAPLQAQNVITNGLVGLWHLNGNALDSSGNGHNGTINGATVVNSGKFGQAYTFDGNSNIDVGDLSLPGDHSVSGWIRTTRAAITED